MHDATPGDDAGPAGRPGEVFGAFLRLGLTSFGGPIAHLGYFREELVARRRWVSERQYAELVALCQFLPGPASSQVGFALGLIRGGPVGGLAAWAAFTLPSALLLVLFAAGAVGLGGPLGAGLLAGLQAVAAAVVAQAVVGMARTLTPDATRAAIGAGAAAVALLAPGSAGQLAAIAAGAAAGLLWCRAAGGGDGGPDPDGPLPVRVPRSAGVAALAAFGLLLGALPLLARAVPGAWTALADAAYRAGALVFGGGHVVLPLLQAEPAVASAVPPAELLAGYGAAQAVPGPLFTFAAYVGFEAVPGPGAPLAALLALVAVFVPGLLLLVGALPFWVRLRTNRAARAGIAGANAAVVGILAAALWTPVLTSGVAGPATLLIAAGGFVLLALVRAPAWAVVAAGAAAGALSGLLGLGGGWG